MSLDVLYLSHNRREFTELTFSKLVENTNWDLVDRLIVYDDSSTDGALEEITSRIGAVPVQYEIREHDFGSPVAVMNDYIASTDAERFVKIDNDLALPPGWLDDFMSVMSRKDAPVLLGTEGPFMCPPAQDWDGVYSWHPWRHIGGVGIMRTDFFKSTGPMKVRGHHGFTEHQWEHNPLRGWMNPDLATCLLDRCPIEPWVTLSSQYRRYRWQRPWKLIPVEMDYYWNWFTETEQRPAARV